MKNREQLHRFVKKLSKSEKRAFKLYVSKYETTKDKKIIQLFDCINKMDEFDESKLWEISSKKILNYNLHRLRQYLLYALSDLNFKKEGNHLGEIINRIELGFKYEMPAIIEEELTKGYKLVEEPRQSNYINILMTSYEYKLGFVTKDLDRIIEVIRKRLLINEDIKEDSLYDLVGRETHLWHKRNVQTETMNPLVFSSPEVEAKFNEPIKDKANLNQSVAFYTAHNIVAFSKKDFDEKLKVDKAIFNLYINSGLDPQENPSVCFSFDNLVSGYLRELKILEAQEVISVFVKRYMENKKLLTFSTVELIYYRNILRVAFVEGKYEEIISLLPEYEKYFERKKGESFRYIGDYQMLEFKILVAISYFYLKNYDKCLEWIAIEDKFLLSKNASKPELSLKIKFVEILCYYDLEKDEQVEILKRKIYYLIFKKGADNPDNKNNYKILQAILSGKPIPESLDQSYENHYVRIFGINALLKEYLLRRNMD